MAQRLHGRHACENCSHGPGIQKWDYSPETAKTTLSSLLRALEEEQSMAPPGEPHRMREALPDLLPWVAANYTAKWEYRGWRQCLEILLVQQRSEKHFCANRRSKDMPKCLGGERDSNEP